MDFKPRDFKEIEYNPFSDLDAKGRCLVELYPGLGLVPAFKGKITYTVADENGNPITKKDNVLTMQEADLMLRLVIMMVDQDSPLSNTIADLTKRAEVALDVLNVELKPKLERNSKPFTELRKRGELFREMVYQYFSINNATMIQDWFTAKTVFDQTCKLSTEEVSLTDPQQVNAKRQLVGQRKELRDELIELERQLFAGDSRIAKIVSQQKVIESLGGYAEEHAQELPYIAEVKRIKNS